MIGPFLFRSEALEAERQEKQRIEGLLKEVVRGLNVSRSEHWNFQHRRPKVSQRTLRDLRKQRNRYLRTAVKQIC